MLKFGADNSTKVILIVSTIQVDSNQMPFTAWKRKERNYDFRRFRDCSKK